MTLKEKRHQAALKAVRSRRRNTTSEQKEDISKGFLTASTEEQARRLATLTAGARRQILNKFEPIIEALRKGMHNGRGKAAR